jgi:hypothetical protein
MAARRGRPGTATQYCRKPAHKRNLYNIKTARAKVFSQLPAAQTDFALACRALRKPLASRSKLKNLERARFWGYSEVYCVAVWGRPRPAMLAAMPARGHCAPEGRPPLPRSPTAPGPRQRGNHRGDGVMMMCT